MSLPIEGQFRIPPFSEWGGKPLSTDVTDALAEKRAIQLERDQAAARKKEDERIKRTAEKLRKSKEDKMTDDQRWD